MNSFISSFKPSFKRFIDFAGVLLVLGFIEGTLHIQEEKWFNEINAGDFRSDVIEDAIRSAQKQPEIAIIGSSVTSVINPEKLNQLTQKSTDRFVLYSANPVGTRRLFEDIILSQYQPDTVIYVTSPRDWSKAENIDDLNRSIPEIDLYQTNPFIYWTHRWIHNNFYIIRYRKQLPHIFSQKKELPSSPQLKQDQEKKPPKFQNFKYDPNHLKEVEEVAGRCENLKMNCLLVILPTNPDESITAESFKASVDSWKNTLQILANGFENFSLIDLSETLSDSSFYRDTHHANDLGSDIVTKEIAERLHSD